MDLHPRKQLIAAGIFALALMAGSGCGSAEEAETPSPFADDGITRTLVREGSGDMAASSKRITVHYKRYGANGKVLVDTRSRGKPHEWIIGNRSTFIGLDRAVRGMREGSIWEVTIPANQHESYAQLYENDDRRAGLPTTLGPVTYRIEVIKVSPPQLLAEGSGGEVIPYAAPQRSAGPRASQYPLVNATRGWAQDRLQHDR